MILVPLVSFLLLQQMISFIFCKVILEFDWDFYVLIAKHKLQLSWIVEEWAALPLEYQSGHNISYTKANQIFTNIWHYKYLGDAWRSSNTIAFSTGCRWGIRISAYHWDLPRPYFDSNPSPYMGTLSYNAPSSWHPNVAHLKWTERLKRWIPKWLLCYHTTWSTAMMNSDQFGNQNCHDHWLSNLWVPSNSICDEGCCCQNAHFVLSDE